MNSHVESKDLTVPKLDLARFYGLDHPRLYQSPDTLDVVREQFAAEITACALHCRNNVELLDALYAAMPPESGFPFPRKLGEGSTRRAYLLPFGLVLKLERTDDLTPEEMEGRGSKAYLRMRRRQSNFFEMTASIAASPFIARIYGCMMAFGTHPPNVSCLISERLTPLLEEAPDDHVGIRVEDLAFSPSSGELLVYDRRFSDRPRGEPGVIPFDVLKPSDGGMWLENIGRDHRGRFVALDFGNFGRRDLNLTPDFYPVLRTSTGEVSVDASWEPCGPLSLQHEKQTLMWSTTLFNVYKSALRRGVTHDGIYPQTKEVS